MFKRNDGSLKIGKIVLFIAILIFAFSLVFGSFNLVPPGHTGVVVTLGNVSDTVLQEGLHLKIPFAQEIVQIDNRIVKLEVRTEAFSSDLQTVSTVLAVNYRITKNMSYSIYREVGSSFEDVLVIPAVNEVLKAVTAKYTASELVENRSIVSAELVNMLAEKLNVRGIYIEDLNIIDWFFSAEYITAVEARQVAEQTLIKTRTEQEQQIVIAEAEARKRIIEAEAQAESTLIAAEAEAKRIAIEAKAQADANRIIAESLSGDILSYNAIVKWDGRLPSVYTSGGGVSPIFDVMDYVPVVE